ncbi:MAG: UDP-N-acetylmuramoyl-tripeptide--D-alanyl-D-alanine ligase [Muribaculaceae bacterium]
MIHLILTIVAIAVAGVNLVLELTRDIMMLQQNSYRRERYMRWLRESGDTTSWLRLVSMAVLLIALSRLSAYAAMVAALGLFGLVSAAILWRRKYKKPLVWTRRVWRIFSVVIALVVIAVLGTMIIMAWNLPDVLCCRVAFMPLLYAALIVLTACYCISHVIVVSANWLLAPVEKAINRRYYNDAKRRLEQMPDLKIIGITGSYGKTSTKHYLYRILSEHFDTLMTPGSFNTTLGVVRTVREYLKPYHQVFIVEMGAKQKGDIAEICDLVHPSVGIVTAVGPQHLESFKTIENVQATKFELVDALPADGLAVVNNDFEKIADRPVTNTRCVRYGVRVGDVDYTARNIEYSAAGSSFEVVAADGYVLSLRTRLVGECNISNLLAAVAVARHLGVPDKKIAYAVERIEQVEHRLSVKRTPAGVTIIDDAFNSNPVGSAMALDVLSAMRGGKRIVITPGMIELGEEQEALNETFGRRIASSVDVAIIVGKYNRDAIVRGITEAAVLAADCVHAVDTFADAQLLLASLVKPGDTVLYENDLPDTFK